MAGEELIYLELGDRRLTISPGERTVGRSHRCNVVVDDRSVSRVHAMVSCSNGRLTVQDLNSSNGTYVNGELLRGEADLCDGDELRLGEAKLRVRRIPGTQSGRIPVDELTAAVDERFTEYRANGPPAGRPRNPAKADGIEVKEASESKIVAADLGPVAPELATDEVSEMQTGLFPAADRGQSGSDWQDYGTRGGVETAEVVETAKIELPPATESATETATERQEEPEAELLSPIDFSEPPVLDEPTPRPAPYPLSTPSVTPLAVPRPRSRPRVSPAVDLGPRLAAGLFDFVFLAALALMISYLRGGMVTAAGRSLAFGFASGLGMLALVGSWVVWGATPGQRMVGLQVCDDVGKSPLTLLRALRRLVGFSITIATLGLGFVSLVFHREKLALHDLISATRVIRKP